MRAASRDVRGELEHAEAEPRGEPHRETEPVVLLLQQIRRRCSGHDELHDAPARDGHRAPERNEDDVPHLVESKRDAAEPRLVERVGHVLHEAIGHVHEEKAASDVVLALSSIQTSRSSRRTSKRSLTSRMIRSPLVALSLLRPSVRVTQTHDGFVLESTHALPEPAPTVLDWLVRWAREQPERTFLAERQAGGWRRLGYRDAQRAVEGLAGELVRRGAGPRGPVMILSDNSVDHGLVTLAAMQVGAPVVPVSPAYSLASTTFGRLHHIASLIEPAVVFAEQRPRHAKAFDALGLAHKAMASSDVRTALERPAIATGRANIGPDTVAKVLFTSGSTGEPKGVVNTHRMLTANQESLRACWPFLDEPPVVVDWLPWSHTFGGNHNFNLLVLRNGGTLYRRRR